MSILPCDRCGQCGCQCGALPYTITATFSGLKNKTHSEHCSLTITSDFGSGAKAVALSPGGDSKGPMTAALVTEGGCGYAKLGHVEPALTISGGSGTGATFTPTLEVINASQNPSCYVWQLKSVEMDGGTGYSLGEYLTITANDNAFEVAPAVAKLAFGRKEPEIKATASGGSGAELKVSLSQPIGAPKTWSVESVSVKAGGNGYKEGSAVTFSYGPDDTEVTAAEATISTKHAAPTLSASTFSYSGGTGATFGAPVLVTDDNEYWRVQSVPVISAGSGYIRGEAIQITVVDGEEVRAAFVAVRETTDPSGFGGIVRVEPYSDYDGGEYFKDTGIIDSVSVTNEGEYYSETGVPGSVNVVFGGGYYLESKTALPCVAKIGVSSDCYGYTGGNKLSAVVDANVNSVSFGEIKSIAIGEATNNSAEFFQAWRWVQTANESLNGVPIVLVANSPKKLVTVTLESCFGEGACASVLAVGLRQEPEIELTLTPGAGCSATAGNIDVTLAGSVDEDGLQYWSLSGVKAVGGTGHADSSQASIVTITNPCLVIDEPIDVVVTAVDGEMVSAKINSGGKFWNQLNYDGQPGPIRKVQLVNNGVGYAIFGREEPSLNIAPVESSAGSGASFTPTFTKHEDECGVHYWKVDSVSVSGGTCFNTVGRTEPLLAASVAGGSGITLQVSTTQSSDLCGCTCWRVDAVSASGGSGYKNDSDVLIRSTNGAVVRTAAKATLQTDENGSPIGVSIQEPGEYFVRGPDECLSISPAADDDKQAEAAELTIQANDDGTPTGVTVVNGGAYYRENKSLPPYVADVAAKIVQIAPSNGSGAELSVVIDDDTESDTFGIIKSIRIDQPGSKYEILGAPHDCNYTASGCKDGYDYAVSLQFRGRGKTPRISLTPSAVFDGDEPLEDCNTIPTAASVLYGTEGGSVQLAKGGIVVTDCDPDGYCAGGESGVWAAFCKNPFPCATKVSWTLAATIPDEKDPWGQSIFPQPGTFSFSKNIVPPEPPPPPPVDPSVRSDWYPGNTWFIPFDYDVNFPIGYFGWPPLTPSGYYRPGIGASVYPVCIDEKAYLYAFLGAEGALWCVYTPNTPPFVGLGLDDEALRQNGPLPVEWVNGIPRIQAGTYSFSHSTGCGSGQITLNYSLTVEYT